MKHRVSKRADHETVLQTNFNQDSSTINPVQSADSGGRLRRLRFRNTMRSWQSPGSNLNPAQCPGVIGAG
jgi:hypothetical protein